MAGLRYFLAQALCGMSIAFMRPHWAWVIAMVLVVAMHVLHEEHADALKDQLRDLRGELRG